MTFVPPGINPAFAKFIVKIEPPLPKSAIKNKRRFDNLAKGLTVQGKPRKLKSKYSVAS